MAAPFAREIAWIGRWIRADRTRERALRVAPWAVLVAAFVPRAWFVGQHPLEWYLVSNMEFFDAAADRLASGDTSIRDTFTPAGYPLLLVVLRVAFGKSYALVGYLQALLGAATCALGYLITRRITRSAKAALLAGAVLALYLPLVVYTGFLLTETLFAFLVALLVWLLDRAGDRPGKGWAALAGLVLGAATTVRPNLLLAFPLLAVVAIRRRRSRPGGARALLVALAFALPVLGAAVVHNSRLAGRPTGIATNGGVNFFLGHCECRAVTFPPGGGVGEVSGHQNRQRYTGVFASPRLAYDEGYYYRETLRRLGERPTLVVRALVNVGDGLGLTGLGESPAQPYYPGWSGHEDELRAFARVFAFLAIVPAFVHAAWLALARRGASPDGAEDTRAVVHALLASMLATLYLYLGDPRLRVPFDPLVLALALDAWGSAIRAARPRSPDVR